MEKSNSNDDQVVKPPIAKYRGHINGKSKPNDARELVCNRRQPIYLVLMKGFNDFARRLRTHSHTHCC